jgi:predicted permease
LVGIPLATSLFGSSGASVATLLSVALIPTYNMLAVISLSLFRKGDDERGGALKIVKRVLLGIVKNPLIISIFAGCVTLLIRALFVKIDVAFRLTDVVPVYKVLESLSAVATPLSLIVLGGQFEFSAVKALRREIITGTLVKGVIVPVLALGTAYVFFRDSFNGAHFAAFVAAFATPTGVSTVPMAQEMDSDVTLAGQLVVWTTLVSALTVFLAAFILRAVGVFA